MSGSHNHKGLIGREQNEQGLQQSVKLKRELRYVWLSMNYDVYPEMGSHWEGLKQRSDMI